MTPSPLSQITLWNSNNRVCLQFTASCPCSQAYSHDLLSVRVCCLDVPNWQLDFVILFGWTEDREVNRWQVWRHYRDCNSLLLLDCNKFV